jgi:hypothetical protein
METVVGNPGTPADEANVGITVSMTDVRLKTSGLPDYSGQLLARVSNRITDRRSGPSANEAATLQDTTFQFAVPCTPTASTTIGSTCSLSTTIEAIAMDAGVAAEGARAVWRLGQAELYDGGADGNAFTEPNTVFAVQGLFVP